MNEDAKMIKVPEDKKRYSKFLRKVGVEANLADQAAEIRGSGGSKTPKERKIMQQLARRLAEIAKDTEQQQETGIPKK